MRYSLISAIAALSASVLAQESTPFFDVITVPADKQVVQVGETLTITWNPATPESSGTAAVDIYLLSGATQQTLTLSDSPIAVGVVNSVGTYAYEIPASVAGKALYGIKIQSSAEPTLFQYSYPFVVEGESSSSVVPTGSTTTVQIGTNTGYVSAVTAASSVNSTVSTAAVTSTYAHSNHTTLATGGKTTSVTKTASVGASSTATTPAQVSANPAAANFASSGLALFGAAIVALAL